MTTNLEALHERAQHTPKQVQLNVRIPEVLKDRFDAVVRALGIPAGTYLTAVLEDSLPVSEEMLRQAGGQVASTP